MLTSPPDLHELARAIKTWGAELGFADVRIADVDLAHAEAGLQAWLDAGCHGEMDYMASHGMKRARPNELVPGTVRAIVARMEGAGDPVGEGRKICDELVEQLSETPGIGGVHIMAPGNDAGLAEVVASVAQIAQRKSRKAASAQAGEEASEGWLLHLQ